jgi:hypothetical protein
MRCIAANDLEKERLSVSKPAAHALVRDRTHRGLLVGSGGQMRDRLHVFDR